MANSFHKLLVIDDDDAVRAALAKNLEANGFRIDQAADGAHGYELAKLNKYDAIISDIRMPKMDGLELTKQVRKLSQIPIILITGFSELVETQTAFDLGANEFIAKPFKTADILVALNQLARSTHTKTSNEVESGYCKLSIEDFISGSQINYDIFIRLSDTKYVKVAHKGEDIHLDRIKTYKAKGVQHLYMRSSEFAKYIGLNLVLLDKVDKNPNVSNQKKLNLIKHTGEIILEHMHLDGIDEDCFQEGRAFVESLISILASNPEISQLLQLLLAHSDVLYIHSVSVALYAQMAAKKAGWVSPSTLCKVAMGGLLHDIGEKELDREILLKPRRLRSLPEVKSYESHTIRGLDILRAVQCVPQEVIQIVHQHHENCSGTGYPGHLFKERIFPPARLIAVVDEFCNMVLDRTDEYRVSPREAIRQINEFNSGLYDQQFLKALSSLFPKDDGAIDQ